MTDQARMPRLVLASASPARRRLLESAGVRFDVVVSGVDEPALLESLGAEVRDDPARHCLALARAKAEDVAARLADTGGDAVVVGCDSVLDLDGVAYGKPSGPEEAARRWREQLAGRSGVLRTGHWLVRVPASVRSIEAGAVASTVVRFGTPDEAELSWYVGTGEPLAVAGAFTLDGLSAPFVTGVDGDPSNVVGLSLPLLRSLLGDVGVGWTSVVG